MRLRIGRREEGRGGIIPFLIGKVVEAVMELAVALHGQRGPSLWHLCILIEYRKMESSRGLRGFSVFCERSGSATLGKFWNTECGRGD